MRKNSKRNLRKKNLSKNSKITFRENLIISIEINKIRKFINLINNKANLIIINSKVIITKIIKETFNKKETLIKEISIKETLIREISIKETLIKVDFKIRINSKIKEDSKIITNIENNK